MKRKFIFLSFLLGTFCLFTSCDNFFNGDAFKTELDDAISYASGDTYSLVVIADEGTGEIVVGGDEHKLKVSDSFEATFRKKSGYRFIKWGVFSKSGATESLEDYVTFGSPTELTTKITLVQGSNDIQIKPICEKSLSFTKATPTDDKAGVPRDSGIALTTNFPLSADNDLSKIEISIANSDVDGRNHFETPELLSGDTIYIPAKLSNRIDVADGDVKKVTVTLPADFIYTSDNGSFEIGEELSHSYRINSETCDKTLVTYGIPLENSGSFKVNGIVADAISQNFNINDRATITFKENDGFKFNGWNNSNEEAILIVPSDDAACDENGYNATTKTATATIIAIGEATNVIVSVNVEKIPDARITGYSPYGRFTFNITGNYYEGKGGTLGFTADSEYQFIRWQVWNSKIEDEKDSTGDITNAGYIKIDNVEDINTDFTLLKVPASDSGIQLQIQPICVKRPKIVSATPGYDASGVYRDRTIVLLFDKKMEMASIYWTKAELDDLLGENKTKYNYKVATDKKDSKGNQYYYAYVKKDSNGSDTDDVHYKNISITKVEDENLNLLQYYGTPAFDATNPRFLRIPANQSKLPPVSVNILVSVSKAIYTEMNTGSISLVSLKEDYTFSYRTNAQTDSTEPEFFKTYEQDGVTVKDDFYLGHAISDGKVNPTYTLDTDRKSILQNKSKLSEGAEIKNNNLFKSETSVNDTNIDLYIQGKIEDGESGPASLQWTIQQINTPFYPVTAGQEYVVNGQISKFSVSGTTASIDERIVLKDLGLPEGSYQITLYAYDNNVNVATRDYYFVWDNVPPKQPAKPTENREKAESTNITCTNPSESDVEKVEIYTVDETNTSDTITTKTYTSITPGNVQKFLIGSDVEGKLKNQHRYSYVLRYYDYSGNYVETESISDVTKPSISSFNFNKYSCNYTFNTSKPISKIRVLDNTYSDACKSASLFDDNGNTVKTKNVSGKYVYTYSQNSSEKLNLDFEMYDLNGNSTTVSVRNEALQLFKPEIATWAKADPLPNWVVDKIREGNTDRAVYYDLYGRKGTMKTDSGIAPTGYKFYTAKSFDNWLGYGQTNGTRNFTIPYGSSYGNKTYWVCSYVTINGHDYNSEIVECPNFWETGMDTLIAYTLRNGSRHIENRFGFMYRKDRYAAGWTHMHWRKYRYRDWNRWQTVYSSVGSECGWAESSWRVEDDTYYYTICGDGCNSGKTFGYAVQYYGGSGDRLLFGVEVSSDDWDPAPRIKNRDWQYATDSE